MPNASAKEKRVERRRSEQPTFRMLVDAAGSAIVVFDREGRISEFNPAAERLHCCTRDEMLGKRYLDVFAPEGERATIRRDVLKASEADLESNFELTITARDGRPRVIAWNGARLRDERGATTGMVVIGQDVTARRSAEEALRESEERFRELAEAAPILVWMTDSDYRCTYVNRAWLDFTGQPREAMLGDAWSNLIHPEDRTGPFARYREAVERCEEFTVDHRLRSADGSYRWIFGRASPRFEADGTFAGFVGCSIDITDRRRAEMALRNANAELERQVAGRTAELSATVEALRREIAERKETAGRLESVMANSPDFIAQVRRDGGVIYLNRAEDLALAEVLDTTMFDWIQPEGRERAAAALERVFEERTQQYFESTVVAPLSEVSPTFGLTLSPVIIDGRVESAVINARDLSQEIESARRVRELEAELARAHRMSTMGEMAAAIAHELHQPLAAAVNYAGACTELLRSKGRGDQVLAGYLTQVEGQILRAGEIIHRIRDFLGDEEPVRTPLAVRAVIDQTAPLLQGEARASGVALDVAATPDLPPVLADKTQVQQILVNLVKNAIEATSEAPKDRVRRVLIEADSPLGGAVEIRVSDNGPGLSSEAAARAFEPFFSTKSSGMGFGLSISRSIAEAHGGSLVLRETSDGGSTFALVLPRAKGEKKPR